MKKGKFIVIEGIDGCGKTTLSNNLYKYIKEKNDNALLIREPGSTVIGENIRKFIFSTNINPRTEALLFTAARSELLEKTIIPTLNKGINVICDRYYYSTIVYQGIVKNVDLDYLYKINSFVLEPDLVIYLYTSLEKCEKRIKRHKENNKLDYLAIKNKKIINNAYIDILSNCKNVISIDNGNLTSSETMNVVKKNMEL